MKCPPNAVPFDEIYKTSKTLKLSDYILLQNVLLVKNYFKKPSPQPLLIFLKKTTEQHNHSTPSASKTLQNNIASDLTELSRMKVNPLQLNIS